MKSKCVIHNGTDCGNAATWGQVAVCLRAKYPDDAKVARIADSLQMGILGEMSWRAVETPLSFTIASAFGSTGLAVAMLVGAP